MRTILRAVILTFILLIGILIGIFTTGPVLGVKPLNYKSVIDTTQVKPAPTPTTIAPEHDRG